MRALVLAASLAFLLAVPTTASPGTAPVQTILDAVPRVVEEAIREARFDGTPDEAEATVASMRAFVAGFEDLPEVPAGSVLAAIDGPTAYRFAVRVTELTGRIPVEAAMVERRLAACEAWSGNATVSEVLSWGRQLEPASANSLALVTALGQEATGLGLALDLRPLEAAVDALQAWYDGSVGQAVACQAETEASLGIEAGEGLFLQVLPARSWPGGEVRVLGVAPDASVPVRIQAPGLFDRTLVPDSRGVFESTVVLPATAALGNHTVQARSGAFGATADLGIDRAPSRILLRHDGRAEPGRELVLRVQVTSLLDVGAGPVLVSGDLAGSEVLADGVAQFRFVPDEAGILKGRVEYPGSLRVQPDSATYAIVVREAGVARTPTDAGTAGAGPDWSDVLGLSSREAAAAFVLGVLFVVLLVQGVRALRRRGSVGSGAASGLDAAPGLGVQTSIGVGAGRDPLAGPGSALEDQSVPGGLVAAYVGLHLWLLRRGWLRPSQTPREAAAVLARRGIRADTVVRAFEEARYGGRAESAAATRGAPGWVRRVRERLGRAGRLDRPGGRP